MKRTGAAVRRMLALTGLSLASLAGIVSTAAAQYGAPLPFAGPAYAQPIGDRFAPPSIAPVGYYDDCAPCDQGAPCGGCGACDTCQSCDSCAPCDSCGSCESCCECETCESCQPCCAGPRCQDPWYVALSGGWQTRQTVHEVGAPTTFIVFDDGFAANAAIGYRFNMFRVEAETSFMNNECEQAGAAGFVSTATGNVNLKALMFNIYHDVDLSFTEFRPYVGAGIGIYQSSLNSLYPAFFADPALAPFGFNTTPVNVTSDMPLAYQFRAGLSRSLGARTELYGGYRYFRGEDLTFAAAPFASPAAPTFHPNGAQVHSVELGLRIRF